MAMTVRSLAGLACLALVSAPVAAAQETSKAVVAAAVRDAGYECMKPSSVKRDPKATSADEKAWIIQCEKGGYRVKFTGDTGAKVEPVGGP
jgi:hypothetical protein